jgi:hypothetical protein
MRSIYLLAFVLAACSPAANLRAPVPVAGDLAPTPAPTRTPIWKDQVFVDYKAKLTAAQDDPRQITRLFVAAFAHYDEDRAFALDLMSAAAADTLVHDDPNCRSGKLFNRELDPLWIAMDGHPTTPTAYFDAPANALAADADAHVQLEEAGTAIAATTATIALKPAGGAARPVQLIKQPSGWRISEFAKLVDAL